MASYEIVCADCGELYDAARSTAKVCPSCRLARNITYAAKKFRRVRSCRACGGKFRPIHAQDYDHCGTCAQSYQSSEPAECGFCEETKPLIAGTKACPVCAKHPTKQEAFLRALRQRTAFYKRRNAARMDAVTAGTHPRIRDNTAPARDTA